MSFIDNIENWSNYSDEKLAILICHLQFHARYERKIYWVKVTLFSLFIWIICALLFNILSDYPYTTALISGIYCLTLIYIYTKEMRYMSTFRYVSLKKLPPRKAMLSTLEPYKHHPKLLHKTFTSLSKVYNQINKEK